VFDFVILGYPDIGEEDFCSIYVSCYMCPESESYFKRAENSPADINPWDLVQNAGESNGYNDGNALPTLDTDFLNGKISVNDLKVQDVLKFTAGRHLNYSFTEENNNKIPGLIMEAIWSENVTERVIEALALTPYKTVYITKEAESLVYCQSSDSNKYISALVSPFESVVWALFVLSLVLICLIPGLHYSQGLNVLWELLGQPPQGKKIAAFVALVTVAFIPLQYIYKEFFSTNAMTPFEKPYLETNKQLFESGFRFVCYNDYHCNYVYRFLKKKNLGLAKNISEYLMGPTELGSATFRNVLAVTRDKGTEERDSLLKDAILRVEESYVAGTTCHMVQEYWSVYFLSFQFTGKYTSI